MPVYKLKCCSCDHVALYQLLRTVGCEIEPTDVECKKCGNNKFKRLLSNNFAINIEGFAANKLIEANKHVAEANDAMEDAKTIGVSKTEIEEGYGLLTEREKDKGLEPGALSGKRESRYEAASGGGVKLKEKFTRDGVKKRAKEKLNKRRKIIS